MVDTSTFDYVIVGGGTAGCVLANHFSTALPNATILVIEAGKENDERIKPSTGVVFSDTTDIQWNDMSVPPKGLGGAVTNQMTGKVMGGLSAVNLQAWTRGLAADFDRWAEEVDDPRWSWTGLLPYFKNGLVKVTHVSSSGGASNRRNYPLRALFKDVFDSASIPQNYDVNFGDPFGYGDFPNNTSEGEGMWAHRSYPRGANVRLWTETEAARLLIEDTRVVGVDVLPNTAWIVRVIARKEVILCSGYKFSPKLLLWGGIGPKLELKKHSIRQVLDLEVGENYSDHPYITLFFKVRGQGLSLGDRPMVSETCDWTAGTSCDWILFHKSDNDEIKKLAKQFLSPSSFERFDLKGRPQTESLSLYGHLDFRELTPPEEGSCISFPIFLVAPESRGSIKLSSASPSDSLLIDPGVFTNPLDEKIIFEHARKTWKAVQKSIAVTEYGAVEYGIPEEIQNDVSDDA